MGTDLSAMVIGFATRDAAIAEVRRAIFELTGLEVADSMATLELAKANRTIGEQGRALFGLHLGFDYDVPHIVLSSLARWHPEDTKSYEKFVGEIKTLFPGSEIVLMSDYDVNWLEGKEFSADDVRSNTSFIPI